MINDEVVGNFIKVIEGYKNMYGVNATLIEFEDKIIEMKVPRLSYYFKEVLHSTNKEHDKIINGGFMERKLKL